MTVPDAIPLVDMSRRRAPEPRLPYDVIRQIVELVAEVHPNRCYKLMCVSRALHDWVGHVRYHTLDLLSGDPLNRRPPAGRRPPPTHPSPAYFGHFVRRLALGGPDMSAGHISKYLIHCTGVTHLVLRTTDIPTKTFIRYLENLRRVQRLGLNLASLKREDLASIDMFGGVTHLEVFEFDDGTNSGSRSLDRNIGLKVNDSEKEWADLAVFTSLTHLAINGCVRKEILEEILEACPKLRVLILFLDPVELSLAKTHGIKFGKDERLVIFGVRRSQGDDAGGMKEDFWKVAEGIIKDREEMSKDGCYWVSKSVWTVQRILTPLGSTT